MKETDQENKNILTQKLTQQKGFLISTYAFADDKPYFRVQ